MTINTDPIFPKIIVISVVQVTTANANRDGTGTIVDVIAGDTDATRIHRITIKAVGTTTAGMIRLYIYNGTNTRLWKEIPVTAITPSATVTSFESVLEMYGESALHLPTTFKIQASTEKSETFNIIAEGGDYS